MENTEKNDDLQKSLDENLAKMNDLIKSSSKEKDLEEQMKNPAFRKKIKDEMKKYDEEDEEMKGKSKEEDDESDSDDDADEMKGKAFEGKETDEEEAAEEAYNKAKKVKDKMKKSLDEVVLENEEIFDGVPVLKSFSKVMEKMIDTIANIDAKVNVVIDSSKKNAEFQKSFADVLTNETQLIKSISDVVNKVGNSPVKSKGVVNKFQILKKSGQEEIVDIKPSLVKSALMNGFQKGQVNVGEISKWELSRYDFNILSDETQQFVKSFVNGGK